jgi:hypothetical protein
MVIFCPADAGAATGADVAVGFVAGAGLVAGAALAGAVVGAAAWGGCGVAAGAGFEPQATMSAAPTIDAPPRNNDRRVGVLDQRRSRTSSRPSASTPLRLIEPGMLDSFLAVMRGVTRLPAYSLAAAT